VKYKTVGMDIGYSNVKCAVGDGTLPRILIFPAGAGPVEAYSEDVGVGAGHDRTGDVIEIDGRHYVAGVEPCALRSKRNRHRDYPLSEEYLALYRCALLKLQATEINVLVTGVPVDQYTDKKLCEQIVSRLSGTQQITENIAVNVHDVAVTAQPVGSFADASFQLSTDSDRQIVQEGRVLVLDPGSQTLDWAAFDQGRLIRTASGSSYLAMGQMLELAAKSIETELGDRVKPERIEQALRRGTDTVLFHGEHLDYSRFIKSALQSIHRDIVTELLNSKTLEREQFDLVIVTGGGANYYRQIAAEAFRGSRIEVLPHPVAGNVRGYWLLATARQQALASTAPQQTR